MMWHDDRHLNAEAFQGLLDGSLPDAEAAAARGHLDSCVRCRSEMEGWELLFGGLDELADLAPSLGFADRVMQALPRPEPERVPLAARVRSRLAGLAAAVRRESDRLTGGHLPAAVVQDLLDGALARDRVEAAEAHLHGCRLCRDDVVAWRSLMVGLDAVPRLAPSPGFGERVMAHVRVQTALAVARPTGRERMAAWLGALSPRTRRRVAGLAGAAVTPVATMALVAYVVFSHPLVTFGNLLSFLRLEAQDALGGLGATASQSLESGLLDRALDVARALAGAPGAAALVFAMFSAMTVVAVWVLYRNLVATSTVESGYARASL